MFEEKLVMYFTWVLVEFLVSETMWEKSLNKDMTKSNSKEILRRKKTENWLSVGPWWLPSKIQ